MNNDSNIRIEVSNKIKNITDAKGIYEFFRYLKYPEEVIFDKTYRRKKENFDFRKEDFERINEIYSILSFEEHLHIFLIKACSVSTSFIRSVTNTFSKQFLNFILIFTINYSEIVFVLPEKEIISPGKHKLIITKLRVVLENIYYTDTQILSGLIYEGEETWREIWRKWREAFNVEKVTKQFFEDYKIIFFYLRDEIETQNISRKESHEFTLQLLNRIMFIYFVAKKKWLSYPKFMNWYWTEYKKQKKYGSNEFFEVWLNQLFFKAFNNQAIEIINLPKTVHHELEKFPFLNGGLFTENAVDLLNILITDEAFRQIYNFYEKYNFTIKEDAPLDYEVAVDPQMIGYVYESLANVAEEIYDRTDLGIFYTPVIEVDFMCRKSIVEFLAKNLPTIEKNNFYYFVFGLSEEREKYETIFNENDTWFQIKELLDEVAIVDPACGSGAFLVGMQRVLFDLYKIVFSNAQRRYKDFRIKYRIIQRSIYGVDVMPWAIQAAELRLWLHLIVDAKIELSNLKKNPLLPNLNLNLRVGDSLIQEINGSPLNFKTELKEKGLLKRIGELKKEKRKYFKNSSMSKFHSLDEFRDEELRIFKSILEHRIYNFEQNIEKSEKLIKGWRRQTTLDGDTITDRFSYDSKANKQLIEEKKKIENYKTEIKSLKETVLSFQKPEKKPFFWEIDFSEIFGIKGGFDIVIGNPPYVKQELISPPNKIKSEVTDKHKGEYKEKLIKSIESIFPEVGKISKKSDYYIYFYFHGLKLLNKNGIFCFITSNSWLDVAYSRKLKEFLVKNVPIYAIYDYPKRSFVHAEVNTIIALFGSPQIKTLEDYTSKQRKKGSSTILNHTARFIKFKQPFEEILSSDRLIELDEIQVKNKGIKLSDIISNLVSINEYRILPIEQRTLYLQGFHQSLVENQNLKITSLGSYHGEKWGSLYLYAPDILFTILEKGKEVLIKLTDISVINEGRATGANNFFFIPLKEAKKHAIEEEFLLPGLMKTRDKNFFEILPENIDRYFLQINISKKKLNNYKVNNYIDLGKRTVYTESKTLQSKKIWWKFTERKPADLFSPCGYGSTFFCAINKAKAITSNSYTEFRLKDFEYKFPIYCFFNSVIGWFFLEVYGRKSLGGGMLKVDPVEFRQLYIINKESLKKKSYLENRKIGTIFEECGINPSKEIVKQKPKPPEDRRILDNLVFDALGLDLEEREEVYRSLCQLVKERLEKAKSSRR